MGEVRDGGGGEEEGAEHVGVVETVEVRGGGGGEGLGAGDAGVVDEDVDLERVGLGGGEVFEGVGDEGAGTLGRGYVVLEGVDLEGGVEGGQGGDDGLGFGEGGR